MPFLRFRWAPRAAVAALILTGVLTAQDLGHLDDDGLQKLVVELQPVVEKVCGRKFKQPPVAVLSDSGDMMRVFRVELGPQVTAMYKGQARSRIRRALQLRADMLGASVIGKYEFASGEVLVVPERVMQNLAIFGEPDNDDGDPGRDPANVLRLFVAHELVHALQDQEMQFGKRYAATTRMDVIDSLALRTEGHAVMASELVMEELGLTTTKKVAPAIISGSQKPLQGTGSFLESRMNRCRSALLYLTGADLMYEARKQGGNDKVWQILHGDETLAQLLRPRDVSHKIVNLKACFDGIEDQLASRTWIVGRNVFSEIQQLSENYAEREKALQLLAKCRGAAEWMANSASPFSWRAATSLRFVDAETATEYRELAERCAVLDLTLALGKAVKAEAGPELSDSVSCVLVQHEGLGRAQVSLHWFQRGKHLVQVTMANAPLADEVLTAVAEKVLSGLMEQASK